MSKNSGSFVFKDFIVYTYPIKMSSQTIEHIVLFKFNESDPSKVDEIVKGLQDLLSLDQVLHLTAGPLLQSNRSSSSSSCQHFTHLLHSRYKSEEDLKAYSDHPDHLSVVKTAEPIRQDIMAMDWTVDDLQGEIALPAGSILRISFLKMKERLGEEVKTEILGVLKEIKTVLGQINQYTYGENFSPARAKGFSAAYLMVFPGVAELEALHSNVQLANLLKQVREHLEDELVFDYQVPA